MFLPKRFAQIYVMPYHSGILYTTGKGESLGNFLAILINRSDLYESIHIGIAANILPQPIREFRNQRPELTIRKKRRAAATIVVAPMVSLGFEKALTPQVALLDIWLGEFELRARMR